MATKNLVRAGVLAASLSVIGLSAAPAGAATIVSQSDAKALTLSVLGNDVPISAGVTATHDGTKETVTGPTSPAPSFGELPINIGVLTQQATAGVEGTNGVSEACAGAAGQGAAVIEIGESSCIDPSSAPIDLSLGALSLPGLAGIPLLGGTGDFDQIPGIDTLLTNLGPLGGLLGGEAPTEAINSDILENFGALDEFGLFGSLGVVEARCEASPGKASGGANIAGAYLTANFGGQEIKLVDLPVNPAPNTKVVTNLSAVLTALLTGLENDLNETFDGALAGLTGLTDQVQTQIVDGIVASIQSQLAPLEENILDITLNKQSSGATGEIEVTALDLKVLPALGTFGADVPVPVPGAGAVDSLIHAQIGTVSCGPNGTVAGPAPAELPPVPTAIAAGEDGSDVSGALIAGLLAVTVGAGVAGQRWYAARR